MRAALVGRTIVALATVGVSLGVLTVSLPAQELRTIRLNSFGAPRLVTQAVDLGFMERRGIRIESSTTQESERQAQALLDGQYDITSSDADNYVHWSVDRGADFVIFMVAEGTVNNQFYVTPEIQTFEDLRGKTIAVDSAFSGQSSVLRLVLRRNGLEIDRDYTFLPVGSSAVRAETVREGRAVGANLNQEAAESEDGRAAGLRLFARGSDYINIYPSGPMGTTRRWAAANPALLLDFIAAIIDTQEFLLDPANASAAAASIARTDRADETRALQTYRQIASSIGTLTPEEQVRDDMIQVILDLRADIGLLSRPTPPTSDFVFPEWYALALRMR